MVAFPETAGRCIRDRYAGFDQAGGARPSEGVKRVLLKMLIIEGLQTVPASSPGSSSGAKEKELSDF
jgi:hypothetical protein